MKKLFKKYWFFSLFISVIMYLSVSFWLWDFTFIIQFPLLTSDDRAKIIGIYFGKEILSLISYFLINEENEKC